MPPDNNSSLRVLTARSERSTTHHTYMPRVYTVEDPEGAQPARAPPPRSGSQKQKKQPYFGRNMVLEYVI